MTIEEAKQFVRNYENYEKVFGIDILTKCLKPFDYKDFSTFEYVPLGSGQDRYYESKGYPVLRNRTSWEFEEWKDEWMRKVRKLAREYRVPDHYQLKEKDLLFSCLIGKFPYLADFEFSVYHLDKEKEEIYIKCENKKSLYTPIYALLENDFSLVEKRMNDYFGWYYAKPDHKEYLEAELATLETETAKRLKSILNK